MAQTKALTICPGCEHFVVLPAATCPLCGAAFDEAAKEGAVFEASLASDPPNQSAIGAILESPEKAAAITGREIGQALLNLLIAGALGVGMFFFGRWVVDGFRGPGVLFFGILPMVASPILIGYGIIQLFSGLFSSRRGKTPKAAFEKVWTSGYFNSLALTSASGTAAARVYRSLPNVPGGPSAADLGAYLEALKKWVQKTLDAAEATLAPSAKWKNGATESLAEWTAASPDPSLAPSGIVATALGPNLQRVTGTLRFSRKRTQSAGNDKTNEVLRCTLLLSITSYCVRHGKYWVVTDATPRFPEK